MIDRLCRCLFAPPPVPEIPDLGAAARVPGLVARVADFAARTVEWAFFLGAGKGVVLGLAFGVVATLLLTRVRSKIDA